MPYIGKYRESRGSLLDIENIGYDYMVQGLKSIKERARDFGKNLKAIVDFYRLKEINLHEVRLPRKKE
ncbi:MAG: hypothetical protein ACOCUU_02240 [Nanoarchaeota archaeon]